ncbi:AraC family transcriptional regulator [Salicibibacter kimchii]|uniref:AraC family transcriptional regulator n=1 Tax=Salicibibacter kimchii TaxID=2099786 RepID=A0A345C1B7_9BACI|nr:AraC family transcriptional regulator [Salicibibacter kimchii]AXF56998.1 AraC family transcriptional regulator [Salicibibacter kimchii]
MNDKINIYESKHKENDKVKKHFHQTYQILYALDGNGSCFLDEQEYCIRPDSLLVIAPFTSHSIEAQSKMTVLVLEFDEKILSDDVQNELLAEAFQQSEVRVLNAFDSSEFRQLLRKMLYEQSHGDHIREMVIKIHLSEMLCILIRSKQEGHIVDQNVLRVERIKNYIERRYFEIESAEDLANKMNMSKRYAQSIFKEMYNRTPMQYLTEVRIGLVKKMLIETNKSIVSICFEVGFESLSTFYRIFKNQIGVPPNVYRTTWANKKA